MKCLHPLTLSLDGRRQFVPCGKCNYCLEARRAEWSIRLRSELRHSSNAHFITLTYSDDRLPVGDPPPVVKDDLQKFIKRLRKLQSGYGEEKLRYYAVGEYGSKFGRPHYHVLMFNMRNDVAERITDVWDKGIVDVGTVTGASIHYVAKYHVNRFGDFGDRAPPFCLMSRKPGIGAGYFETHAEWHMYSDRLYTVIDGYHRALPRYYKTKIFENRIVEVEIPESERAKYLKEIERLKKFHEDPHAYYNEMRKVAHDKVKHKSNQFDKL